MKHEIELSDYLARQDRMLKARADLDLPAMFEILKECAPYDLEVGTRYRAKVLGGHPANEHLHVQRADGTGPVFGLNVPVVKDPAFVMIEFVFVGRRGEVGGLQGMIVGLLDDGEKAWLADMDLLSIESL